MSRPTLVTGAAGVLGRAVLVELAARGLPARGLSRRAKPGDVLAEWWSSDMLTGNGLSSALDGVGSIVHCASDPTSPSADLSALDRLIAAAKAAGSPHLIFVGIAGIERAARNYSYYRLKLEAEQRIRDADLASTIVRSTQFHPFVAFVLRRLATKVAVVVPRKAQLQPVCVDYIASQLVDTVTAGAGGQSRDLHGPEAFTFGALARTWLAARRRRTPVLEVPIPIQPLKALAELHLVRGNSGGLSWGSWLSEHPMDNAYGASDGT